MRFPYIEVHYEGTKDVSTSVVLQLGVLRTLSFAAGACRRVIGVGSVEELSI